MTTNTQTKPPDGIDLTAILFREGIKTIEVFAAHKRICITMMAGGIGVGPTVRDALANAKQERAA